MDLTANANRDMLLHYKVPLTKQFNSESMRLVLQWNGDIEFDIYGEFADDHYECITGPISRPCGGMTYK